MKNWYKSKTIWYAIISAIAAVVAAFAAEFPEIVVLGTINSIAIMVLRFLTTTEIK